MNVLAFNGSHRGPRGNTHVLLTSLLDGMRDAGATVDSVALTEHRVEPCRACYACAAEPGACAIDDDAADLLARYAAADLIVWATPLYLDSVTGRLKILLDRMIPLMDPRFAIEAGESFHPTRLERPPRWVVLAHSGFPERSHLTVLSLYFKRLARNLRSEIVAEILRNGSGVLRSRSLADRIRPYLDRVTEAGRQIVAGGRIADDLAAELSQPLMPADEYVRFLEDRLPDRKS